MNEQVRPQAQIAEGEEIDLREYLEVIMKRKISIILFFMVACISAGIYTLTLPKIYQSSSILAVLGSVITDERGQIQKFSQPTDFYVELAKSEQLAQEVIQELKLDQPPDRLTPAGLISSVKIESKGNSPSIKITVNSNSPRKAKDIANTVAEKIVKINYQLLNAETGITKDLLFGQIKNAEQQLKKTEETLLKFTKENNLEVLRQKVSNALSLRGKFELEYNDLIANIEVKDGELKEIAKSFKDEERIYKLVRSLVEDPAYQQILAKAGGKDVADFLTVKIESEQINPLYENLRTRLTDTTITLATLKLNKKVLEERMKKNEEELNSLRLELANGETALTYLTQERDLAREKYYSFVRREIFVKTAGEVSIGRISIAALAIEPTQPSGPSIRKNVLTAGFLGLFLGIFLAFLREYLSKSRESE